MRFSLIIVMKLSGSRCSIISVLIATGILYLVEAADEVNEFRRCYNSSVEMHCFTVQYDTNNGLLIASNDNARQRCNNLSSNLLSIKDEETSNLVESYLSDPSNPILSYYVWTDAYRISDYNNTHTWHWVNSKLPNMQDSELSPLQDYSWYVASLEFRNQNGKSPQFYLTPQQPWFYNSYSYVCEYQYPSSKCSSSGSNVLQFSDRCYISFITSVSWYEARNRCLKDGGDLATFANVSSINFTSWLGSDPYVRYWIGLRFSWYIWRNSGDDIKFSKWTANFGDWSSPCLIVCKSCNPSVSFSWLPMDCDKTDSIRVVCHSVTPLQATTLTTKIATTLPITTSSNIATQTGSTETNKPGSNSSGIEKNTDPSSIPLAVGVGVGVGVPVIVAIIVIAIFVARRHQSKKPTTKHREEAVPTDDQNGTREDEEVDHYATVRSVSPSQPSATEQEPSSETQYATLGFNRAADPNNGNRHVPLNVL